MSNSKFERPRILGVTPFFKMWDLVLKNHTETGPFSPEFLMGIFWEESAFRNMRQREGSLRASPNPNQRRAVGFGQVVPFWIKDAHPRLRNCNETEIEALILSDDNLSVQVTSRALAQNLRQLGNATLALNQYGSGDPHGTPANLARWRSIERGLLNLPHLRGRLPRNTTAPELQDPNVIADIKAALGANSGQISADFAF